MTFPVSTLLLLVFPALTACEARRSDPLPVHQWVLEEGRTVRSFLTTTGDTAVVLVYAPSDCFTCDGELAGWSKLAGERGWEMHLFLTGTPSTGERDQLRLFRIRPAGVLADPGHSALATPRVYRFDGQVPIDSAVGSASQAALLGRVTGPASASDAAIP